MPGKGARSAWSRDYHGVTIRSALTTHTCSFPWPRSVGSSPVGRVSEYPRNGKPILDGGFGDRLIQCCRGSNGVQDNLRSPSGASVLGG